MAPPLAPHPLLATREDLASRTTDGWISTVDSATQDACLRTATDEAIGLLGRRYVLPLVTWSDDVTDRTCAIAKWKIACRTGTSPREVELLRTEYTDALAWFRSVATGDAQPAIVDSSTATGRRAHVRSDPLRGW